MTIEPLLGRSYDMDKSSGQEQDRIDKSERHSSIRRWGYVALVGIVVFVTAAVFNPEEDRHLRHISEVARSRGIYGAELEAVRFGAEYKNYFVFSVVSLDSDTLTYGFLHVVKGTGNLHEVFRTMSKIHQEIQSREKSAD